MIDLTPDGSETGGEGGEPRACATPGLTTTGSTNTPATRRGCETRTERTEGRISVPCRHGSLFGERLVSRLSASTASG